MKRFVCTLLVVIMVLGTVTGCSGKTNGKGGKSGTLTVGIPGNTNVTDYDDNAFTRYLEEVTGLELEIITFATEAGQYSQQFSLMVSSNEELPDVVVNFGGMSQSTINMYGQDEYIVELTDLIEKYGKNFKEQMARLDEDEQWRINSAMVCAEDNGIYAMPTYSSSYFPELMQNKMMINREWLNKLGLKEPTNVNELRAVLEAFATKDPNGNGEADEIPMLASAEQDIAMYILNAFQYYNKAEMYNVKDGKLYIPATTNEYREGLKFVNKLVSDNLLSNMSFTINRTDAKALLSPSNQVARVGIWCGHPENSMSADSKILNQYEPLSPLADATGAGGYGVLNSKSLSFGAFITQDCEDQEAAMKFLDAWYLDETVRRARHGEPGVDWERSEGKTVYGTDSEIKVINEFAFFKGNSTWGTYGCTIQRLENAECISQADKDTLAGDTAKMFEQWHKEMQDWKQPEDVCRSLRFTDAEQKEADSTAWASYLSEARTLFCTGNLDPNSDKDWNDYKDKLEEYGQSRILKIAQKVYDRQYKDK